MSDRRMRNGATTAEVAYRLGDRVKVKSIVAGEADPGEGEVTEVYFNRGARTLVIRIDGQRGRYLRLEEQVEGIDGSGRRL